MISSMLSDILYAILDIFLDIQHNKYSKYLYITLKYLICHVRF